MSAAGYCTLTPYEVALRAVAEADPPMTDDERERFLASVRKVDRLLWELREIEFQAQRAGERKAKAEARHARLVAKRDRIAAKIGAER